MPSPRGAGAGRPQSPQERPGASISLLPPVQAEAGTVKYVGLTRAPRPCPHCSGESGDERQRYMHTKHGCPLNMYKKPVVSAEPARGAQPAAASGARAAVPAKGGPPERRGSGASAGGASAAAASAAAARGATGATPRGAPASSAARGGAAASSTPRSGVPPSRTAAPGALRTVNTTIGASLSRTSSAGGVTRVPSSVSATPRGAPPPAVPSITPPGGRKAAAPPRDAANSPRERPSSARSIPHSQMPLARGAGSVATAPSPRSGAGAGHTAPSPRGGTAAFAPPTQRDVSPAAGAAAALTGKHSFGSLDPKLAAKLLYPSGMLDFAAGAAAWSGQLRTMDAEMAMKKRQVRSGRAPQRQRRLQQR